ncbi:MAG: hypothetical protein WEE50_09500 [Chloroflexota bacterium]
MISLRRHLGLLPDPSDVVPVEAELEPVLAPLEVEVEFAAYAEDCRIFGFWRHDAERLTDGLNAHDEYLLQHVLLAALDDGHTSEARELLVRRDEVLAIRGAGPRGNVARRARTRPSPVTLKTGPYTIHGYIHGPPGADAVRQINRRRPMVPLTDAWIEYPAVGNLHRARVGPIIVNHEVLDWIRPSRDEEVQMPGLPVERAIDPHAKDLTGYILTWQE